jgi:hypothetical protein
VYLKRQRNVVLEGSLHMLSRQTSKRRTAESKTTFFAQAQIRGK